MFCELKQLKQKVLSGSCELQWFALIGVNGSAELKICLAEHQLGSSYKQILKTARVNTSAVQSLPWQTVLPAREQWQMELGIPRSRLQNPVTQEKPNGVPCFTLLLVVLTTQPENSKQPDNKASCSQAYLGNPRTL